jgi:hypothetical protein
LDASENISQNKWGIFSRKVKISETGKFHRKEFCPFFIFITICQFGQAKIKDKWRETWENVSLFL